MVRVKTTSTVPPMRGGKVFCNDPEVDRRRNETYYKLNYYVHIDYMDFVIIWPKASQLPYVVWKANRGLQK